MAEEEERRNPLERETSDIRSSSGGGGGAGELCSSSAASSSEKHSCCICKNAFKTRQALCGHMRTHPKSCRGVKKPPHSVAAPAEQQIRDVRDSAAAEQRIIPVQELVPVNDPANNSIVAAGAGVAVDAIITAHNGTVSDVKKKVICSSTTSSSASAGGSGAHTCGKCGKTFATGQSLGGHMRKHYVGLLNIVNKKRTREQPDETPAPPTVDALLSQSHNPPALLSLSAQSSDGGDCGRNREEPERLSAGDGARRLHNLIALLEKEPKNAPQPEPERKDDDELLSLRLGQFDSI